MVVNLVLTTATAKDDARMDSVNVTSSTAVTIAPRAFAHYSAAATGFMGVVVATALMAGKVRNATSAILNASLLIALSMAGVARGSASVILDGPESIAKHVTARIPLATAEAHVKMRPVFAISVGWVPTVKGEMKRCINVFLTVLATESSTPTLENASVIPSGRAANATSLFAALTVVLMANVWDPPASVILDGRVPDVI